MKITEETITPRRAQELLDVHWKHDRQRTPSQTVVDAYARLMQAHLWGLTHQGIAVADDGELIDGIHRLLAVVQSGASVRMMVARGVPAKSKTNQDTIDLIDRGRLRTVGQQLQLRHNYANGNLVASASRSVLVIACRAIGIDPGRMSVSSTLAVLDSFGSELTYCISERSSLPGLRNGAVLGAFAFAMRPFPEDTKGAYTQFVSGENVSRGNPMLTLRNFIQAKPNSANGNVTLMTARATLQALHKIVLRESLGCVKSNSDMGLQFFLDKQKQAVNKLLTVCGYVAAKDV